MKKIFLLLAGITSLSFFLLSCEKTCVCKSYVEGVNKTTIEYPNPDEVDCATFNTFSESMKTGVKCE